MASLVNRSGWCVIRRSVQPCTVLQHIYAERALIVLLEDGERKQIDAYRFTTYLDTANEWRVDNCEWCNGTGKQDADGEYMPCPHCQPMEIEEA